MVAVCCGVEGMMSSTCYSRQFVSEDDKASEIYSRYNVSSDGLSAVRREIRKVKCPLHSNKRRDFKNGDCLQIEEPDCASDQM
jgi:hypothetical protein